MIKSREALKNVVNVYKCENFQILQLQNCNRFVSDHCILPSEQNQTSPTCLPRSELGSLLNRSAAPHNLLLFINNIYILGGKLLIHFIKLLPVHSVFVVFCTYKNLHTCNSQASEKRRKWKMKILYCRYISLLEQFSRLQLMNPSHPDMTSASVFSMHGTLGLIQI